MPMQQLILYQLFCSNLKYLSKSMKYLFASEFLLFSHVPTLGSRPVRQGNHQSTARRELENIAPGVQIKENVSFNE
jgi:hypothetical protein